MEKDEIFLAQRLGKGAQAYYIRKSSSRTGKKDLDNKLTGDSVRQDTSYCFATHTKTQNTHTPLHPDTQTHAPTQTLQFYI